MVGSGRQRAPANVVTPAPAAGDEVPGRDAPSDIVRRQAQQPRGLAGDEPGIALRRERGSEGAPGRVADAPGLVDGPALAQEVLQVVRADEPEGIPPEAYLAPGSWEP